MLTNEQFREIEERYNDVGFGLKYYGKTWVAYRQKPDEIREVVKDAVD